MIKTFFKTNWQWLAAISIFIIISCVYFSPSLDGYSLNQGDIKNGSGMRKEIVDYKKLNDEQTLWTGTSFSGMPSYQISVKYTNPLMDFYYLSVRILSVPIVALFCAFLCFFILAKSFNAGFYISMIGALSYGMATYNFTIIEAGHNTKMMAIAFIPGVIGAMVMIYRKKRILLPFAILTLFFALELMVNHIQMTYYFVFVMVAIGLAEFVRMIKANEIKLFFSRTALIVCAGLIGLLANFGNYYNTYEFTKKTMRGSPVISISAKEKGEDTRTDKQKADDKFNQTNGLKRDYITQWSYGKGEAWNLFVSSAKGDSKNVTGEIFDKLREETPQMFNEVVTQYQKNQGKVYGGYWGDQPFTSGPSYMGAIIIFLALMYIIFVQNAMKWFLLQVTVLALLLAMGKNLVGPGSNTVILFTTMLLLSGVYFCLDFLLKNNKQLLKPLKLTVVCLEGLIVLFLINRTGGFNPGIENMWLTNFFIDTMPLYAKFRAVSSILVVVNLAAVLMGVLFLVYLVKNLDWAKRKIKFLGIGTLLVVSVLAFLIVKPQTIGLTSQIEDAKITELSKQYVVNQKGIDPLKVADAVTDLRAEIFTADALKGILFILLTFAFIFVFIKFEKYRKYALGGIVLLVTIDMWTTGVRYLNNFDLEHTIGQNENVRQIASAYGVKYKELKPVDKKKKLNRLRPGDKVIVPIPNRAWKKGGAYDDTYFATPGDLQIYEMEAAANPKIKEEVSNKLMDLNLENGKSITKSDREGAMFSVLGFNTNYRVLDVDNPFNSARVSYFHKSTGGYNPAKLKRYQDMIDFYISNEIKYLNTRELDKMKVLNMLNNKYYLYQGKLISNNPSAYGNAWFVDNIKWVEDNNAEILAIKETDLKSTAIIHEEFKGKVNESLALDSNRSISMTSYLPNHITYQSNAKGQSLAVFSEVYYNDGWNVYIDGDKVDYVRANYIVRALSIPGGKHTIEFKFEPSSFKMGNTINLIGFFLILLAFGGAAYFGLKGKQKKSEDE